ncbi:conserved hypothetical protein, partial [Ricinus communis]
MGGAGEGWPCGRLRRWRQCAAELAPNGWVADASRISGRLMDVLEPWGCLQISRLWVFPDVFGLSGCMRTSDLRGAGYYGKEGHWPQRARMLRPAMACAACRLRAGGAFGCPPTSGVVPGVGRAEGAGADRAARPGLPARRRTRGPGRLAGLHAWRGCACWRCCHRHSPTPRRTGGPRNAAPGPPRPPIHRRRRRRDSLRARAHIAIGGG